MRTGTCYGLGVGPGDPELITVKALRLLQSTTVVAYFSAVRKSSNARQVVARYLTPEHAELHLVYPVTTEALPEGTSYDQLLLAFYDACAEQLGEILDGGTNVVVLCEGDPLLHGSFMYLSNRLAASYPIEVVPGVPSMLGAAAVLGTPLVCRNEVLQVLPGTLEPEELASQLRESDAAVIMKLGRRLAGVREAVEAAGLLKRAWYVERATMDRQRVLPLAEVDPQQAPYFSLIAIPSDTAGQR